MAELAVVMTYYDREPQLRKTLESFARYNPSLFEVIIVDDCSPEDLSLDYPFETTVIKVKEKHWINSSVTHNIGFGLALKSKIVVIQNPECYHRGDIFGFVRSNLTESNYLSFGCYSLACEEKVSIQPKDIAAKANGDSGWYNHSRLRAAGYHFCSAISVSNLKKINGMDESFAMGYGYEDDYFLHQIRTLGLQLRIIDNPFVVHQYHYDRPSFKADQDLFNRTGIFVDQLKKENKYCAVHFITEDL